MFRQAIYTDSYYPGYLNIPFYSAAHSFTRRPQAASASAKCITSPAPANDTCRTNSSYSVAHKGSVSSRPSISPKSAAASPAEPIPRSTPPADAVRTGAPKSRRRHVTLERREIVQVVDHGWIVFGAAPVSRPYVPTEHAELVRGGLDRTHTRQNGMSSSRSLTGVRTRAGAAEPGAVGSSPKPPPA
jgi:hypothetical protein